MADQKPVQQDPKPVVSVPPIDPSQYAVMFVRPVRTAGSKIPSDLKADIHVILPAPLKDVQVRGALFESADGTQSVRLGGRYNEIGPVPVVVEGAIGAKSKHGADSMSKLSDAIVTAWTVA